MRQSIGKDAAHANLEGCPLRSALAGRPQWVKLVRVPSDRHKGPVVLLTLLILVLAAVALAVALARAEAGR